MTRTGPKKQILQPGFDTARLRIGESYLKAARSVDEQAGDGDLGNPLVSLVILAAIGFADALAAKFGGILSVGEHSGAASTLRSALGNRLPRSQENAFVKILIMKVDAQYSMRVIPMQEARTALRALESFAIWARQEFHRTP